MTHKPTQPGLNLPLRTMALSSVAALCLPLLALAQTSALPDPDQAAPARPDAWIEPRVAIGLTLSNNSNLSRLNPQSEQALDVRPGLRVLMNRPRLQGFLDYSLSHRHHVQGTAGDGLRHELNASATLQAWDQRAFVDLSGVVADQSVSALGLQSVGRLTDANRSQTASFGFSPYFRGQIAALADYELRYRLRSTRTETAQRSDVDVQELALRLDSRQTGSPLGWSLDASLQEVEHSLGRRTEADAVRANLIYSVSPQLRLSLQAGVESNDVLTLTRQSYQNTGLGLDWRPSTRTRVALDLQQRYFGSAHSLLLEHRSRRTVWRFSDTRSAVNSPLEATTASLGSLYDLLDRLYVGVEPDPIRRAQRVQSELNRLGLPANLSVHQSFLSSSALLQRNQQLSVAWLGVRGIVTLTAAQGRSSRLSPAIRLGDDFDHHSSIRQRSWSASYAHRLTPLTSISTTLESQRAQGSNLALQSRSRSLTLGLASQLGLRTSAHLQLRRTLSDGAAASAHETAVAGLLTHRF